MDELGLVGLPNTGKTTLFNAITGLAAPTAPYPHSTAEPHMGVAQVPDPLLDRLAQLEGSARVVHAPLELLDLPVEEGRGFDARFLGRLREVDGLVAVVRAFVDEAVPGPTDPVAQAEELLLELALADLELLQRRLERVTKEATAHPEKRPEAEALRAGLELLEQGGQLRAAGAEEAHPLGDLAPLTGKPTVWVVNVAEEQDADLEALSAAVPTGDQVLALCGRLEEEVARLPAGEQAELSEGLGLGEGAAARLIRAAYRALSLVTFYTVNQREARAWTAREGATALQAAGKVHSDLERGFIRAEVAPIAEVVAAGGWPEAKRAGLVRVEGRDYRIDDGDVLLVRFSV